MEPVIVAQGKEKILLRYTVSEKKVQDLLDFRLLQLNLEGERIDPMRVEVTGEYVLELIQGCLENKQLEYQIGKVTQSFTQEVILETVDHTANEGLKGLICEEIPGVMLAWQQTKAEIFNPPANIEDRPGIELEIALQVGIMAEFKLPALQEEHEETYLDKEFLENIRGISLLGPGIIGSYMVLYQDGKNYVFGLTQDLAKEKLSLKG